MKIRPVGAQLFHVDGQRDMTQLIINRFTPFANASENVDITVACVCAAVSSSERFDRV